MWLSREGSSPEFPRQSSWCCPDFFFEMARQKKGREEEEEEEEEEDTVPSQSGLGPAQPPPAD